MRACACACACWRGGGGIAVGAGRGRGRGRGGEGGVIGGFETGFRVGRLGSGEHAASDGPGEANKVKDKEGDEAEADDVFKEALCGEFGVRISVLELYGEEEGDDEGGDGGVDDGKSAGAGVELDRVGRCDDAERESAEDVGDGGSDHVGDREVGRTVGECGDDDDELLPLCASG